MLRPHRQRAAAVRRLAGHLYPAHGSGSVDRPIARLGGACRWWSLSPLGAFQSCGGPRSSVGAASEGDDPGVDLFVVPFAQEDEVVEVGGSTGPRHDVVSFAPPSFAFATRDDAASVAGDEGSALAVRGGVGDRAEVDWDGAARHHNSSEGRVAGPALQDRLR